MMIKQGDRIGVELGDTTYEGVYKGRNSEGIPTVEVNWKSVSQQGEPESWIRMKPKLIEIKEDWSIGMAFHKFTWSGKKHKDILE
jgi:hypothetical protein